VYDAETNERVGVFKGGKIVRDWKNENKINK
jgi:hypothetical protein